jgi:hypothetical protein
MNIENIKITPKTAIKLSKIIDKMGLTSLIMELKVDTGNDDLDNSTLAKELLSLIISNLYKAEDDIYEFISTIMKISIEEAQEIDLIQLLKPLLENKTLQSFLKLA